MVLKVNVGSRFHLEALQSVLSLGNSNIVLSHCASPFQICGNEAEILLSRAAASGETVSYRCLFVSVFRTVPISRRIALQ